MDFTGVTFSGGYSITAPPPPSYKAIFGYGYISGGSKISVSNLVSNTGVVATDTAGVGTLRASYGATGYGSDKAMFGFGNSAETSGASPISVTITNLISNTGVVATDTAGAGTARYYLAAAGYGSSGQAIFGYGITDVSYSSLTNLVSNTGTVATDTAGVGTGRYGLASAGYGTDKAIFGYGNPGSLSMTNLVSNTGVVATDTAGVGTGRFYLAAAGYGTDLAIFGYGCGSSVTSITNLVSNTGVVSTDTAGVGTARYSLSASSYSM